MWPVKSRPRAESGAVAVEAALILPLLVVLIFGMVEFAFVMRLRRCEQQRPRWLARGCDWRGCRARNL